MTQDLSLARAIFTSALLRSDPDAPDIARDDATLFARTLLRTCNICTSSNIKLCKTFIVKNILPSETRTAALAKYLTTISKSCEPRVSDAARVDTSKPLDENEGLGKIVNGKVQQPPEPAFKRLHILYILHDVLCHSHFHPPRTAAFRGILKERLTTLLELAACGCTGRVSRTKPHILDLLSHWENLKIFSTTEIASQREKVVLADRSDWPTVISRLNTEDEARAAAEKKQRDDETKWIVPDRHGVLHDPNAPWHELPAANALYLRRVHGYPLRAAALPKGGFKLAHAGEDAPADLKRDVQRLYEDSLRCFEKFTPADEVQDVDALGNIIWKDPERPTKNFWGFTLDGIEKRRELARHFDETATGYAGLGLMDDAVGRARALAAERGDGYGGGRGRGDGGFGRGRGHGAQRGGWRGQPWR